MSHDRKNANQDDSVLFGFQTITRREAIVKTAALLPVIASAMTLLKSPTAKAATCTTTPPQPINLPGGISLRDCGSGEDARMLVYMLGRDGLPNHPTGQFPNENCPAGIAPSPRPLYLWKNPKVAASPTSIYGLLPGVALNGVAFDPTGPYWRGDSSLGFHFEVLHGNIARFFGLDGNNAHVQPDPRISTRDRQLGVYHYHADPVGLVEAIRSAKLAQGLPPSMMLLGYMADGFPIYYMHGTTDPYDLNSKPVFLRSSYMLKKGRRAGGPGGCYDGVFISDYAYVPGSGDLDECNGRFGVTPEYPQGTYHYMLTSSWPFIPRLLKGTPHPSFKGPVPDAAALPRGVAKLYP